MNQLNKYHYAAIRHRSQLHSLAIALITGALCLSSTSVWSNNSRKIPTHSTTIDLTENEKKLVSVNRDANSISVFKVTRAWDDQAIKKITEIGVGSEPSCVAVRKNNRAYVTNSASGTVSVVDLKKFKLIATIAVGTEPRGCALTPRGRKLYVANHTEGSVSVINTQTNKVIQTIHVSGNPTAIAISNDGDAHDEDETVFVTQFYAELIPGGPGEGFDEGKQGIVQAFKVNKPTDITRITLSPLANAGFTADRSQFCKSSNPEAHSEIFCPDVDAAADSDTILKDPQGAYPNQLQTAVIRRNRLYLPNIGSAPEPPVKFNVNVQALLHVVDTETLDEKTDLHVNLNNQIKTETQPANPTASLDRLFGNDLVAMDCSHSGSTCLVISRGGNYAMMVDVNDGPADIHAPNVVRFKTGNMPNGVVIDRHFLRAYVNNEVDASVSVLNLSTKRVIAQGIPASSIPDPGSFAHRARVGKLVFFTALGTPDNKLSSMPIREIDPLASRGKASDNGWSSCGSCHPDGLADGTTWLFPTGPRQTIPLDGFFGASPADQRISNWSAVRGSITDFNNNSRNIQGGTGFAGDPPNANIFNHGISEGASEALDFETLWVQTIRTLNMPQADAAMLTAGRDVFTANCSSCHGGAKWTKSQVFHNDNPAFDGNPLQGGNPIDPGVQNAGPQIVAYTKSARTLQFLDDIGTFDVNSDFEIRGAGGGIGKTAVGGLGFNVPSLLGLAYSAPYFHNGAAQTLQEAFTQHALDAGTIATALTAVDQGNLMKFLMSIDGSTERLRSDADDFRDQF